MFAKRVRKSSKLHHIHRFLALIFCVTQLTIVTQDYLSFRVATKLVLDRAENITLPSFTVCGFARAFVSLDGLKAVGYKTSMNHSTFEDYKLSRGRVKIMHFLSSLTLRQLQSVVERNRVQIKFHLPNYALHKSKNVVTKDDLTSITYFKNDLFCETVYLKESYGYVFDSSPRSRASYMAKIQVIPPAGLSSTVWFINLSPNGLIPYTHISDYGVVASRTATFTNVRYKIQRYKRLQYPYSTHCKYYEKSSGITQESAIEFCIVEKYAELRSATAPGVNIRLDESLLDGIRYEPWLNETNDDRRTEEEIVDHCKKRYSEPECDELYLSLTSVDSHPSVWNASGFYIKPPNEPTYVTVSYPRMNLVDLLVSIGSTLGLWIGFNFMTAAIKVASAVSQVSNLTNPNGQVKINQVNYIQKPSKHLVTRVNF